MLLDTVGEYSFVSGRSKRNQGIPPSLVSRCFGWYEVLYAALQPLCCGSFSALIGHLRTTLIRRRRWFRRLQQRSFQRWRFSRRFLGRIQLLQQLRRQPQFWRVGFQFERAQFKRIGATRIDRPQFSNTLFPLQRQYVSVEWYTSCPRAQYERSHQDGNDGEEELLHTSATSLPEARTETRATESCRRSAAPSLFQRPMPRLPRRTSPQRRRVYRNGCRQQHAPLLLFRRSLERRRLPAAHSLSR